MDNLKAIWRGDEYNEILGAVWLASATYCHSELGPVTYFIMIGRYNYEYQFQNTILYVNTELSVCQNYYRLRDQL